jgi:hypothetical protein
MVRLSSLARKSARLATFWSWCGVSDARVDTVRVVETRTVPQTVIPSIRS